MAGMLTKRLPTRQQIYTASPRLVQRVLANVEAWQRDRFRRYGDYQAEVATYDPTWYANEIAIQETYQIERLNQVLQAARQVPYYRYTLPDIQITNLADLHQLPILEKNMVRHYGGDLVRDGIALRGLWQLSTSGSTGAPLRFYHDRSAVRAHQAVTDALQGSIGCRFGDRRVRISGVYVAPYDQTKPPFWIYIDRYHQLQCSAYHLGPAFYDDYLRAMRATRVRYGTGYASAWHQLGSYLLASGDKPPALKAIFTDSEGVTLEQQAVIERGFGCPVYQTYGLGEAGQVVMQCREKRYHMLTRSALIEILDEQNRPVHPGETGQVIVTDLTSMVTPFIRYRTGDLATLGVQPCSCGWRSPVLSEIVGRLDDQILTPEGRWVRPGGHVIRPAVGVRESQIVQTAVDQIIVRVVPDTTFDPSSMAVVVNSARRYLGDSMQISWEVVEKLPRTRAGKLRHIVREIP